MTTLRFKKLQAVIFDWAGTTVDCGCQGPVQAFVESFAAYGIQISVAEAREPMGMGKWEHVAAILAMPRVAREWQKLYDAPPAETDIDLVYAHVEQNMLDVIGRYSAPIPGAIKAVADMRARGLRIGSCTGYPRPVAEKMAACAALDGYSPNCLVCATDVTHSRPAPDMCLEILRRFDIPSARCAVKIGDTAADIQEGSNAGMWTIGISLTGSLTGLSYDELSQMNPQRLKTLRLSAEAKLYEAGADFVVADLSNCLNILGYIEQQLDA